MDEVATPVVKKSRRRVRSTPQEAATAQENGNDGLLVALVQAEVRAHGAELRAEFKSDMTQMELRLNGRMDTGFNEIKNLLGVREVADSGMSSRLDTIESSLVTIHTQTGHIQRSTEHNTQLLARALGILTNVAHLSRAVTPGIFLTIFTVLATRYGNEAGSLAVIILCAALLFFGILHLIEERSKVAVEKKAVKEKKAP